MNDPLPRPSGDVAAPRLDGAFQSLHRDIHPPTPLTLPATSLPGGPVIHADPALALTGHWSSPAGRLLEIRTTLSTPGAWFALHLPLGPGAWDARWLTLIARTSAATATLIRPCLRTGTPDGFTDHFFPTSILAQPRESDHHDLLALDQHPDMAAPAPWRDLVLFLPPATDCHLMLHDLRLILT